VDIVPDNLPARKLYEKEGFTYAGDVDLERGIEEIPLFSLFELDLCEKAVKNDGLHPWAEEEHRSAQADS
jgi:hypothetical protein